LLALVKEHADELLEVLRLTLMVKHGHMCVREQETGTLIMSDDLVNFSVAPLEPVAAP
jgi:hypothetical protein